MHGVNQASRWMRVIVAANSAVFDVLSRCATEEAKEVSVPIITDMRPDLYPTP